MNNSFVKVVLVRPIYSRNIGATSRALSNMGFSDLILIAPQAELDYEARQAAARGQEPLMKARVYTSWQNFNKEHSAGLRLAFSTKDGQSRIVIPLIETLNDYKVRNSDLLFSSLYFVFGPEDWGLSNDDLNHCHKSVSIPTYGENPSLNLAQAVLLGLYTFRQIFGGQETQLRLRAEESDFVQDEDWFPSTSLKKFLVAMRFDVDARRVSAYTTLKQYLLRAVPTLKEKRLLQDILEQGARKLAEYNEFREGK